MRKQVKASTFKCRIIAVYSYRNKLGDDPHVNYTHSRFAAAEDAKLHTALDKSGSSKSGSPFRKINKMSCLVDIDQKQDFRRISECILTH